MEKLNKIIVLIILPVLLISSQSVFGHTLTSEDCGNLGLQLDQMNNVCVADLNTVCITTIHGDSFRGGFTNAGTDQFGNSCEEIHPDDLDLFPITRDPLVGLLSEIFQMILPFLVLFVVVIVVVIVIRRRRK